jgi:hypothetical protein
MNFFGSQHAFLFMSKHKKPCLNLKRALCLKGIKYAIQIWGLIF